MKPRAPKYQPETPPLYDMSDLVDLGARLFGADPQRFYALIRWMRGTVERIELLNSFRVETLGRGFRLWSGRHHTGEA